VFLEYWKKSCIHQIVDFLLWKKQEGDWVGTIAADKPELGLKGGVNVSWCQGDTYLNQEEPWAQGCH
jgi:hypothetical protein